MSKNALKGVAIAWLCAAISLALLFLLPSCEVFKSKHLEASDSTSIKKTNEGSVSKQESESEKELDYMRRTWLFSQNQPAPAGTDTVYLKPEVKTYYNTQLQPIAYIEEKGNLKEKERRFNYDSLWRAWTDSMNRKNTIKDEIKNTEVMGWKHLIAMSIGTAILVFLLQYLSKFKLSKK